MEINQLEEFKLLKLHLCDQIGLITIKNTLFWNREKGITMLTHSKRKYQIDAEKVFINLSEHLP